MQLIYEGKNITGAIEIRKADLTDNAGGELDSLELHLNDPKGLWSQWKPEKNHTVQVKESGFDTGTMYADEIRQQRGLIIIKALPIKQEAKTPYIRGWDNVRFLGLAQEIAANHGLTLVTYGVDDQLYSRVDQYEKADFEFLSWRCMLEGNALKISDGKLIIYNEQFMESQTPNKTIIPDDIDGDYGSCKIYKNFPFEFKSPSAYGPVLKYYEIAPFNFGESQRFSKGLLRSKNKYQQTFSGTIRLDSGMAAGNTIKLQQFGLADGNYFIHQLIHKFVEKRTTLKLRKPLEGY